MTQAVTGLTQSQQPVAMLAAYSVEFLFPFFGPPPGLTIALARTASRLNLQVAGTGIVTAFSGTTVVASGSFATTTLTSVNLVALDPDNAPIDSIQVEGLPFSSVVVVGMLSLNILPSDPIGTRYAIVHAPSKLTPLAAPPRPLATFRHRQADIDKTKLQLVHHSLFDVQWPAPVTTTEPPGDPVNNPVDLPKPTVPIAFVAERQDTGAAHVITRVKKYIAVSSSPTPNNWPITSPSLYRFSDAGLADPVIAWTYRVAGFDLFGALGNWSDWASPVGVEKIAAAPTQLRILNFDNTSATGGAGPGPPPPADPTAWVGGTLTAAVNWSGAALMMYPDVRTARATVNSVDTNGNSTGTLATEDITVPPAQVSKFTVASVNTSPSGAGANMVDVQTTPPLPVLGPRDPAAALVLTLADGTSERYVVRPFLLGSSGPIVARLPAGPNSRIVATSSDFIGQPAYLVSGYGTQLEISTPLSIPIDQNTARGQLSVTSSTKDPFDPSEQIIDPNGINAPQPEPTSVALTFTGPQRLVPPTPPTPVHSVDHLYYDPADFTGLASTTLPFVAASMPGVSGYVLERDTLRSLMLADAKRRIALQNVADPNPQVEDGGAPRADLVAWINALSEWLSAYNIRAGTNWPLTGPNTVLGDPAGARAFFDHFYGGLLDDELRALADLTGNFVGFARVNGQPLPTGSAISDSVDGTGYGRTVYMLAAVNSAGSVSSLTGSIGPYYTRIVRPGRPPVFYKLQAQESAIIVAWALDSNPDVAGYLVYRGASLSDLADLRFFGPDPSHPSTTGLATIGTDLTQWPPLSFGPGTIDPRIIALVPDPRYALATTTAAIWERSPCPRARRPMR